MNNKESRYLGVIPVRWRELPPQTCSREQPGALCWGHKHHPDCFYHSRRGQFDAPSLKESADLSEFLLFEPHPVFL